MQGLILEGTTEDSVRLSGDLELVGSLAPRQVRVEVRAAGVCGSDLSCVLGKYYMPTPLVPGHEAAGVVLEVGSAVTYCTVGDHVILSTFGPSTTSPTSAPSPSRSWSARTSASPSLRRCPWPRPRSSAAGW